MNGPLALCAATAAKSFATNPKSPQVRGPPGMPRNSKPFTDGVSALPLVPEDGDHIRGITVGCTTERNNTQYLQRIQKKYQ